MTQQYPPIGCASLKRVAVAAAFLLAACSPLKKANEHYKFGEFTKAIPAYEEALKGIKDPAQTAKINFLIGESYRNSNRLPEALPYYQKAVQGQYKDDNLSLYYGLALKANGKYQEAATQFATFAKTGGNADLVRRAKAEVKNIEFLDSLRLADNPNIRLTNLGGLNSEASDYAAVITNGQIFFASNRRKEAVYAATGAGFDDIYRYAPEQAADLTKGKAEMLSAAINQNAINEGTATFSKDGRTMIFAKGNSGKKGKEETKQMNLYQSTFNGSEWSAPVMLSISDPGSWDAYPSLSADGKTLYFASDRPGGAGGADIWRSVRSSSGDWAAPTNIRDVNTAGEEISPYVSHDGRLFFASDGHPSLGGLDIFIATRQNNKTRVRNLGKPYNSPADDFGYFIRDEKSGLLVSNRSFEGAKGGDDVYLFEEVEHKKKIINLYLAGTTFAKVNGQRSIVPQVKVKLLDSKDQLIEETVSDDQGRFKFKTKLEDDANYNIEGELPGDEYIRHDEPYSTFETGIDPDDYKEEVNDVTVETEVTLIKNEFKQLEETGEVSLDIYYDLDKWDIRPDAAEQLDKLVEYLKSKPALRVELGSHTDNRGSDKYNMELSGKRAQSAVQYIIERGITKERITSKGYGETQLVVPNAQNEDDHQKNRRTTIRKIQ